MSTETKIWIVTDPMCSWCWGMADAVDHVRATLVGTAFDLRLGGINVDSTKPVGRYGRTRLERLWREVATVTGAAFAQGPTAKAFVYNSSYLCHLLEAARALCGAPPFELLRALQFAFFAQARDVNLPAVYRECMDRSGLDADAVEALAMTSDVRVAVASGMRTAKAYGTHALPSVLMQNAAGTTLLAGGYLDAATLLTTIVDAQKKLATAGLNRSMSTRNES